MAKEKYAAMQKPPTEIIYENGKRKKRWRNIFFFGFLVSICIAVIVISVFTYTLKFHCEEKKPKESLGNFSTAPQTINFAWFSDMHLDLYYNAKAAADSSTSFCRNPSITSSYTAPYGRMGCDSPKSLLRNVLYSMKGVHSGDKKPKFILFTGDASAHNYDGDFRDNTTRRERVLNSIGTTAKEVVLAFPSVPYFPSIGNNDLPGHYVLPAPGDSWYSDLLDIWQDSILGVNCHLKERTTTYYALRRTFLKGGYYKVELPATKMILITLNSMYWAIKTWLPDHVEIANEQMDWLKKELYLAKRSGKKVLITSHIPPGMDTYSPTGQYPKLWLANYTDIYIDLVGNIFSDVIAGQMFGHFHVDDFRVLGSPADSFYKKISYILLAASVSPVYKNNPNFRYVQLDPKAQTVVDYEQYYVDLVMATEFNYPAWQLDYRFSTKYPSRGKKDQVINGNRILRLNDNLINKTSNQIYTGYVNSRRVRYNPGKFSRFVLFCAMRYTQQNVFEKCIDFLNVPGG